MPDEVNFVDLAALAKIAPDTVVERFGGMINSSFFDASNILAMLKQKGLIDFTTSFPGQSAITITELGKKLLNDATAGAQGEFDMLDLTLLTQLANGRRTVQDLSGSVNIKSSDLAMHLYKLGQQQYLSYEFRNGNITIALSEKGFLQSKSGMPQIQAQAAQPAAVQTADESKKAAESVVPQQPSTTAQRQVAGPAKMPEGAPIPNMDINQLEASIKRAKRKRIYYIVLLAAVIIVIILALMLKSIK
jgi:DNA-binding MarR family transcriptional regulator